MLHALVIPSVKMIPKDELCTFLTVILFNLFTDFGFASLKEHRVENSLASFFISVGFIAAVLSGIRHAQKGAGFFVSACFICMLLAGK